MNETNFARHHLLLKGAPPTATDVIWLATGIGT